MSDLPSTHRQIATEGLKIAKTAVAMLEEAGTDNEKLTQTGTIQNFRELSSWSLEDIQALWRRQGAKYVEIPLEMFNDKSALIENLLALKELNL